MSRVLLVDDDHDLVDANRTALEAAGHDVNVAYSADEGWKALQQRQPDLLVLDVMMESFTAGFDLARKVARELPTLPMIMLTGVDEYLTDDVRAQQDHDHAWMPVHRFMEKPVSPMVLNFEIESLLHEVAP